MNPDSENNSGPKGSKIPSGIRSIDHAASGALPSGSFVVLFGKSGSGKEAFMQTAALMNSAMKEGILSPRKVRRFFFLRIFGIYFLPRRRMM